MGYHFFLYGVYLQEDGCLGRFKNFIKTSQQAYAKGSMVRLKSGLSLMLKEGSHLIPGQLVELDISENHWPILDALNGYNSSAPLKSLMNRETVELSLTEADSQNAQVYLLNPEMKKHMCSELSQEECLQASDKGIPLLSKLNERHRNYLQRLAIAKGREIVPVDMALYRELMSLELIVDKGRRLALTRVGQEISHFL